MKRSATLALVLCLAVPGTIIEARADCRYVRGSIAETRISLGTEPTRLLGTVTGVLNGAVTVTLLSPPPNVRSLDIFVTTSGDVLRAEGLPTRTPVPGEPGEFITHVDLTVVGGGGQVRRSLRHDGVRWTESHWHCPANRRTGLQGDRVRSECQRRRQLIVSSMVQPSDCGLGPTSSSRRRCRMEGIVLREYALA
jgi:hypothetical protein